MAARDDGTLDLMYVLSGAVFQKRDPTLLPSDERMEAIIAQAALNAIDTAADLAAKGL